jgi:phosphoenolpyruvate phosphomutase-like protein
MPPVRVIMAAPETATGPRAEFWVGDERLAETVLYDGRLHLRLEPRPDGEPLLILHRPGDPLLLPNAWDVATARSVVAAGYPVVAITSWGVAGALGYDDHEDAPGRSAPQRDAKQGARAKPSSRNELLATAQRRR